MKGRAEVQRRRQRLDATFGRLKDVGNDLEVQSDFARYLCVLVSGYLEKTTYELVTEHARRTGAPSLQRFVDRKTKRFQNAKCQKLASLLGDFDTSWQKSLEQALSSQDLKDAVDSVVELRNQIAHGESVGLTYQRIKDYYARVNKVIDHIADLCDPV